MKLDAKSAFAGNSHVHPTMRAALMAFAPSAPKAGSVLETLEQARSSNQAKRHAQRAAR